MKYIQNRLCCSASHSVKIHIVATDLTGLRFNLCGKSLAALDDHALNVIDQAAFPATAAAGNTTQTAATDSYMSHDYQPQLIVTYIIYSYLLYFESVYYNLLGSTLLNVKVRRIQS